MRTWLRRRLRLQWRRIAWLFAILGPGVITSNVDNDAGGIYTYSLAGARYGYSLLWILLPVTVALVVVQEMCARMGTVTGKGLADLLREHFGLRPGQFQALYDQVRALPLGHLAGGVHRDGTPFATVYYGVEQRG